PRSATILPYTTLFRSVLLTIEGCPMRGRIERDTAEATATVPGLSRVEVETGSMTEEQRRALTAQLREGRREIPFNQPGSLTRILDRKSTRLNSSHVSI